jgi:hypothetical protein
MSSSGRGIHAIVHRRHDAWRLFTGIELVLPRVLGVEKPSRPSPLAPAPSRACFLSISLRRWLKEHHAAIVKFIAVATPPSNSSCRQHCHLLALLPGLIASALSARITARVVTAGSRRRSHHHRRQLPLLCLHFNCQVDQAEVSSLVVRQTPTRMFRPDSGGPPSRRHVALSAALP